MILKNAVKLTALVWMTASFTAPAAGEEGSQLLTNIAQIRALSPAEIDLQPATRLEAVVTLHVPSRGQLWLQSQDEGIALFFRDRDFTVRPGDRVQVSGKVVAGQHGAQIAPDEVKVLSDGRLPDFAAKTGAELQSLADLNRLVQVEDRVRRFVEHTDWWALELGSGTNRFWIELAKRTNDNVAALVGSTIRTHGVCSKRVFDWGERFQPVLLVQDLADIAVLQRSQSAATDPYSIPVLPISGLTREIAMAATNNSRVHVQGIVLDQRLGEHLVIRDSSGTIFVRTTTLLTAPAQELVDVLGTPAWDDTRVLLRNAVFRLATSNSIAQTSAPGTNDVPVTKPTELITLTTAREVQALSAERSGWKYPVRLRGVVTFYHRQRYQFFVQDATAGIYVAAAWNRSGLQPGDLVEVIGTSGIGGFAPIVDASQVNLLGSAALPAAHPATLFQLATGQFDSQWVEVRGVVRSATLQNRLLQLRISDPDGTLAVDIPAGNTPTNLVDAVVRVRGVCSSRFNDRRQITGLTILAPSLDDLQIEEQGASNPLDLPTQPIVNASQFRPREALQRRMKVVGVVTLCQSPQKFFLQDASDAIQVVAGSTRVGLKPGDRVMVAGFPGLGDFGHLLRDAAVKVVDHAVQPEPKVVSPQRPLDPELHNKLVRVDARLLNHTQVERKQVLTLQLPGSVFEAHCLTPIQEEGLLTTGSLLQLTGVYRVLADEARSPNSFQIIFPSSASIQVLERPSFWNVKHAATLVGTMALIVATTMLWLLLLRRKVREQTASLAQSESKFRSLVEQSLVGVYIIQDGRYAYVNPRQAHIFGYTPEEMVGSCRLEDTVSEEDLPAVQEHIRRRLAGELNTVHYHFRGKRKDGSAVYVEVLGTRTEFGGKPAVLGTALDITERKQTETALAQASTLLETLLQNSPDHIYFKDRQSRFVRYSQSFAKLLKLADVNYLIGKTDFDLFTEEHARPAYEDEQEIIRTGQPIVGKLERETHMDGRTTWALTTKQPWRDKEGNIIGTFGTSKDVTGLKEAEDRLAYERELFQTLLDTFPDTIYFKDRESRFVRVSKSKLKKTHQAARALFQSKHPDQPLPPHLADAEEFSRYLIGKSDFDTYDAKTARRAFEEEQEIIRTGNPVIGRTEHGVHADGSSHWLLITKMPWRDRNGKVIGTFGVSRDITQLKEAEVRLEAAHKRLVETSRLAGMAEVATDVLHNVGNVLNSVNVSCTLSIDRLKGSKIPSLVKVAALLTDNQERLVEFLANDARGQQVPAYLTALAEHLSGEQTALLKELEQLLRHVDHIKQIVSMQQSYAKVAGVVESINTAQLVEDALNINAAALTRHDVQVCREFDEVPALLTEKHKVLQILVNLIRNAKYALDEASRPDKLLTVKVGREGDDNVVVQVIDNGVGIPAENLTRIFSHGFTTRRDGHGFGLHSSALAVRDLGGSIQVKSDGPGQGATFTLRLPCSTPEKADSTA